MSCLPPEKPRDIVFIPSRLTRVQRWQVSWIRSLKKIKLEPAINWKLVTCHRITSKIYSTSMVDTWARDTVRWYWSADTLFWQQSIDHNRSQHWCAICVQYQSSCAPKLARKCEIEHWLPYGADGRAVYGDVITIFSGMGRFTYPWCSAGALRASELRYNFITIL